MRVPLILLIPILLLVVVIIAGVYRLSIGDEVILTKFSSQTDTNDAVMLSLFQIETPNKWVIEVPGRDVRTLVDYNPVDETVYGVYHYGSNSGQIFIASDHIEEINRSTFIFSFDVIEKEQRRTYIALARFDDVRKRLFSDQALLLGNDIVISKVDYDGKHTISIEFSTTSHLTKVVSRQVSILEGRVLAEHN